MYQLQSYTYNSVLIIFFQACKVLWEWSWVNDDEKKSTTAKRESQEGEPEEKIELELLLINYSTDLNVVDMNSISCDEIL